MWFKHTIQEVSVFFWYPHPGLMAYKEKKKYLLIAAATKLTSAGKKTSPMSHTGEKYVLPYKIQNKLHFSNVTHISSKLLRDVPWTLANLLLPL